MTLVRPGDTPSTIAERIGEAPAKSGAIEIDQTVVTVAASLGCDAELLRETILRRPFGRRQDPIFLPCAEDARLFGSLENGRFDVDRLEVGHVKYFSKGPDGCAHIIDYMPVQAVRTRDAKRHVGRPLSELLWNDAFRDERMPVVRRARSDRGSLHIDVDHVKTSI